MLPGIPLVSRLVVNSLFLRRGAKCCDRRFCMSLCLFICLSHCLSVCPLAYVKNQTFKFYLNFIYLLHVAVARFSSDGSASGFVNDVKIFI